MDAARIPEVYYTVENLSQVVMVHDATGGLGDRTIEKAYLVGYNSSLAT